MSIEAEISRLQSYYPFDMDVLENVATIAEQQRASTWQQIQAGLPDTQIFRPIGGKPIEVLDILPQDYDSVHVYHLPMGNGLDENMKLGIATLAAAEPNKRLIAAGNPGAPGQSSGKLRVRDLPRVWSGDMRPTVDPLMQYLNRKRIRQVDHTGGSCGADRAATAVGYAEKYDHQVSHVVLMDPASVVRRSLLGLGRQFQKSAAPMEGYVQAAESQPYFDARKQADKTNHDPIGNIGLLRASNIAIAHALSLDGFETRVAKALDGQKNMRTDIIWGTESELAAHSAMLAVTRRLSDQYGNRVRATAVKGHKHAMYCDIFLQVALILQSRKV